MDFHPAGASPDRHENIIFQARLEPYRSLSPKGFSVLNILLLFLGLSVTFIFISTGAWLITAFFWAAIALLYLAFLANYRSAKEYEIILLSRNSLNIQQVTSSGKCKEYKLNPFWSKFSIQKDVGETEADMTVSHIYIRHRKLQIEIGRFLNPDEKERFSVHFQHALNIVKFGR